MVTPNTTGHRTPDRNGPLSKSPVRVSGKSTPYEFGSPANTEPQTTNHGPRDHPSGVWTFASWYDSWGPTLVTWLREGLGV